MTLKSGFKKFLKGLLIAVVGVYLIFAGGLALLNWLVPRSPHAEEAVQASSRDRHEIVQHSSGMHSFHARLQLIEAARRSIELEFFIYNLDESSRLLTRALVKKAKEGVKVRILVDFSAPVFQLKPVYARFLKSQGVEVRYYNTNAIYQLLTMQHRSHRKLLIVDGHTVITGGRNIANEYFDLGKEYNFLDTDIEIRGAIVAAALKSFDLYWRSDFSEEPESMDKPLNPKERKMADDFFLSQPEDDQILARVRDIGGKQARDAKTFVCSNITFVTDFPSQGEINRKVFLAIAGELGQARKQVVAESPYFVIRQGGYDMLTDLTGRGVRLQVLTNSLYSTDAFYTVGTLLFKMKWLAASGMELNVYDGSSMEGTSTSESLGRWGVHSKRAVIDSKTVMIGTYNIDPRSANLNSELMIVCRDQPGLAEAVLKDIEARRVHSRVAISEGKWYPRAILEGASLLQVVLLVVTLPVANLFDFLL